MESPDPSSPAPDPEVAPEVPTALPAQSWRHSALYWGTFALMLIALALLVLIPTFDALRAGYYFGLDWGEYLYSAPLYLHGRSALYLYRFPLLPTIYVLPSALLGARSLALASLAPVISSLLILALFVAGTLACTAHTRSRWAGLVGGAAVAGFPYYLYEVGWGGQAQLVAFVFGLLGFFAIFRNGIPGRSFKWSLLAALLLSVSALSELYAASFVLGAVGLLFLTHLSVRWNRARPVLRSMLLTLGLPAVAWLAVWFSDPTLSSPAGMPALYHYWWYTAIYPHLWKALTFSDILLAEAYGGVLLLYGAFRLVFRIGDRTQARVVPAIGAAALIVGFLATPAPSADRSLYFLAFPLGLACAELASAWPRPTTAVVPRRVWRTRPEQVSWALPLAVVASLTVTGVQFGSDVQIFPNSIADYEFNQGVLSQIAWLGHEPGNAVYDAASPAFFPVQWVTDQSLYPGPSFEPYLLTSSVKQQSAVLGWSLSLGPRWFDDSDMIVTDAEPYWGQPAPGITIFDDGRLYETIEADDFENLVSFSPSSDPGSTTTSAFAYASSVAVGERGATTFVYYNWSGVSAVRTVQVLPSDAIWLNYSFAFTTAIPRSVDVYLTSSGRGPTSGAVLSATGACSNSTVTEGYSGDWLPSIDVTYPVEACARNATLSSRYVPSDQYGIFQLAYGLVPTSAASRNLSLSLEIRPSLPGSRTPQLVNQAAVLGADDIRWVVLTRDSNEIQIERFMNDPSYSLYDATPDYFVLAAS